MDCTKYSPIIQELINVIDKNIHVDEELTLRYCHDLINHGEEYKDDAVVALGHYYRALVYYVSNEGSLFYEAITNALSSLSKVQEWELMARCYNCLGLYSVNRRNALVALDYYLSAIKCCKKVGKEEFEFVILINVGALYTMYGRFEDAIENLQAALNYFSQHPEHSRYDEYMVRAYQNMAKAYLCKGMLVEAETCLKKIYEKHRQYEDNQVLITVWAVEAMYYHIVDNDKKCDECIACIHKEFKQNMPIMEMFEDIYDYCRILLDRQMDKEFWEIMKIMEPMAMSVGITNLMLRLLSLKMKFYSRNKMNSEYIETAGTYYELSERNEIENKLMMNNVLNIRKNLEMVHHEKEEIEKNNEILREKSETDPLTGLSNRFHLADYSEELFRRAVKNGIPLTVEILDMDFFKEYNDHYGHQKGDECIRQIGAVIKSMEEFGAFGARYGGDEFVLIYENITKDQAMTYMAELRKRVMDLNIEHQKSNVSQCVTVSQGMCWDIPVQGNSIKNYIHIADNMLYRVKQKARNNFCVGSLNASEEQMLISHL